MGNIFFMMNAPAWAVNSSEIHTLGIVLCRNSIHRSDGEPTLHQPSRSAGGAPAPAASAGRNELYFFHWGV